MRMGVLNLRVATYHNHGEVAAGHRRRPRRQGRNQPSGFTAAGHSPATWSYTFASAQAEQALL